MKRLSLVLALPLLAGGCATVTAAPGSTDAPHLYRCDNGCATR